MAFPRIARWLAVLVACSACASPAKVQDQSHDARVNDLLAAHLDERQLTALVSVEPSACIQDSSTTKLCEWHLGDRDPGWNLLAPAIETRYRINLICSLPIDGTPRPRESCSAHPRRSNRGSWVVTSGNRKSGDSERPRETKKRYRQLADRWIQAADTLDQLSRLMGAVPTTCRNRSADAQVCTWQATNRTFGHGTLAVWIDAPRRKRIRLNCTLPIDGGQRSPGSCSAHIGA